MLGLLRADLVGPGSSRRDNHRHRRRPGRS